MAERKNALMNGKLIFIADVLPYIARFPPYACIPARERERASKAMEENTLSTL
jgi:hypothetical protein